MGVHYLFYGFCRRFPYMRSLIHCISILCKGFYQQNNWLTGANPVGMSFNRFRSFSVAEVGYRFEDGNFGNVSLPASSNKYAVFVNLTRL